MLADPHTLDAEVPSLDHLANAELELEVAGTVELGAAFLQRANVFHIHRVAALTSWSRAFG